MRIVLLILLLHVLTVLTSPEALSCGPDSRPVASSASLPRITVAGGRFVDPAGRQVVLHGVNAGRTGKPDSVRVAPEVCARMRDWGLNVIRLQMEWSQIEPECGRYDEQYLRLIEEQIAAARAAGLHVYLDMHQDLWGVKSGNGAPAWATLDEGRPHVRNPNLWQESYWTSPMVQTAFDNFYANKPGPDGVGIQDRFAMAWRHVAKRYAADSTVIGYDLFNVPYPGSLMKTLPLLIAAKMAGIRADQSQEVTVAGLLDEYKSQESRRRVMTEVASDEKLLKAVLEALEPLYMTYEREALNPLYARVARAIREVDGDHILFLEPSGGAIIGVRSVLQPIVDAEGRRDPQQALAPHAYGLPMGEASTVHMGLIFARIRQLAERLEMPVIVGEWDADPGNNGDRRPMASFIVSQLEKRLYGDTFWIIMPDLETRPYFDAIQRPYPQATAGELLSYTYDRDRGIFRCRWREQPSLGRPTRIDLPLAAFPKGLAVELTPPASRYEQTPCGSGRAGVYLEIPPLAEAATRELTVKPAE
ncbi:MAG: cellulase family glycosylhydrolase [Phycisphaerae bacterium]